MNAMKAVSCDMARNDVAVKLDAQVVREAKMVAAARGITLAEYLRRVNASSRPQASSGRDRQDAWSGCPPSQAKDREVSRQSAGRPSHFGVNEMHAAALGFGNVKSGEVIYATILRGPFTENETGKILLEIEFPKSVDPTDWTAGTIVEEHDFFPVDATVKPPEGGWKVKRQK